MRPGPCLRAAFFLPEGSNEIPFRSDPFLNEGLEYTGIYCPTRNYIGVSR